MTVENEQRSEKNSSQWFSQMIFFVVAPLISSVFCVLHNYKIVTFYSDSKQSLIAAFCYCAVNIYRMPLNVITQRTSNIEETTG
jgi:hypothetical protein